MKRNSKTLAVLILLAVVDTFIPLPITALMLFYVMAARPSWFRKEVDLIYQR
jgi:hypothetical protein